MGTVYFFQTSEEEQSYINEYLASKSDVIHITKSQVFDDRCNFTPMDDFTTNLQWSGEVGGHEVIIHDRKTFEQIDTLLTASWE